MQISTRLTLHMQQHTDDKEIIAAVLQGNKAAYALLVDRYRNYVFALVRRYVPQQENAEELAQDVFVKTYKVLASYRGDCRFSTWLYTITHTTCLSALRRKPHNTTLPGDDVLTRLHESVYQDTPGRQTDDKYRKIILQQAMNELADADAQVLELHYMAMQSIEEIAMITNNTTTNVKVRLYRARGRLKQIIETRYRAELMNE